MKMYISFSVIILLIMCLTWQCEKLADREDEAIINKLALADTITFFTNRLNTQTASVRTLQANHVAMKALLNSKDAELAALSSEFRRVNHIVKYSSKLNIDTIVIPFQASDSITEFKFGGTVSEKWYSFQYDINPEAITIQDITFPNETTIITGIKRKWFLGKSKLVTDITNTNPYIRITDIKAAEIVLPVPWYKKWYIWLAAGIAGGVFLSR